MDVDQLNAFFGPLAPGLLGVVFDEATVELEANFPWSAREGERVVGVATPAHLGRQTHVWDVEVTNETTERTMVHFRCTQMVLSRR